MQDQSRSAGSPLCGRGMVGQALERRTYVECGPGLISWGLSEERDLPQPVWNRQADADSTRWKIAGKGLLANFTHVVAVGQGYSYPVNEAIRVNILQGMEYGYHPEKK